MEKRFTWIPLYRELADRLVAWENRQPELIAALEELRSEGVKVSPLTDKDEAGNSFLIKEIDPFTFFGTFNRGIKDKERLAILSRVKKLLGAESPLPEEFSGIPILNNQRSWLVAYHFKRMPDDVQRLWRVFGLALTQDPLRNPEFLEAFDRAVEVRGVSVNLTMGLFWIRPETFLNLDETNRKYLKIKLPSDGLSATFYVDTLRSLQINGKSFAEISYDAYRSGGVTPPPTECQYWLVGAYWDGSDPPDQTERFLEEGIWENGYDDQYRDLVRAINVGDRIAIKSSSTQKKDLPFEARGLYRPT